MERGDAEFAKELGRQINNNIDKKIDEKFSELQNGNNKNGKSNAVYKILIGVAILMIGSFAGSFISTQTAQKIDREKINTNELRIERVDKQTTEMCNEIKSSINDLEKDQLDQWKYIIEFSNTRGDKAISLKKNWSKDGDT